MNRRTFVKCVALTGATSIFRPILASAAPSSGGRRALQQASSSDLMSGPVQSPTYFDGTLVAVDSATLTISTPLQVVRTFAVPESASIWRNGPSTLGALQTGDSIKLQTETDTVTVEQAYANIFSRRGVLTAVSDNSFQLQDAYTDAVSTFAVSEDTEVVTSPGRPFDVGELAWVIGFTDPASGDLSATYVDICTPTSAVGGT